jgi:hypothetical protein
MGFEIRNVRNWPDVLVESAAEYGMELSIADFYPPDDTYGMLKEQAPQVGQIKKKPRKRPFSFPQLEHRHITVTNILITRP